MDKPEDLNPLSDEYELQQCINELVRVDTPKKKTLYDVKQSQTQTHINSLEQYQEMYRASLNEPEKFWKDMALDIISWDKPFSRVSEGEIKNTNSSWFLDGKLNACYNCVDRWAHKNPDKVAIIHEQDDANKCRKITYGELLVKVSQFANLLKSLGAVKGDVICIYMPNSIELFISMLGCARIGALHNVIFAGFSPSSLVDRIEDSLGKFLITCDEFSRGGKQLKIKEIVDEALIKTQLIKNVVVFQYEDKSVQLVPGRDVLASQMENMEKHCDVEFVDSSHLLFILYTSGSTGKPKGVAHATGGYLVYVGCTIKYVFDVHPNDIFGCVADIGWISGHSYVLYGPLIHGLTTLVFSSTPTYPHPGRYWEMIEKHKITQFYTAPTAVRSLIKFGNEYPLKYNLDSVRVIGSVGETINPEAWKWYHDNVGRGKATLVDTYWQTETGGITMTPIIGCTPTKPGSVITPFFGIEPAIVDASGRELFGNKVKGLLCFKRHWPGTLKTVYLNHNRFAATYISPINGFFQTGDAAYRDEDGHYWICGRADDVISVCGHRMSSVEMESALTTHSLVAEAAVVGYPHEIKGQGIYCFVTLKQVGDSVPKEQINKELVQTVRKVIGPIATPDYISIVEQLPKTRSGKIVRRILRQLAAGSNTFGDVTTVANVEVIELIKKSMPEKKL